MSKTTLPKKYSVIYQPSGRALEYSDLACNLFTTCMHGCTYCYGPSSMHKKKEEFTTRPELRHGILDRVDKDCQKMAEKGDNRRVLFSFASDPCQDWTTIQAHLFAMRRINQYRLKGTILTKGGLNAAQMFSTMILGDWTFGQSVSWSTSSEHEKSQWEPHTASIHERYRAFEMAKQRGIRTWASMEPVINITSALMAIDEFAHLVDHWKLGKWNHDKRAKDIDWALFVKLATAKLQRNKASYTVKKDLQAYMETAE